MTTPPATPSLTPAALDELERLMAEATPGEWTNGAGGEYIWIDGNTLTYGYDNEFYRRDSDLICAAHNALPALLAAARRYQWLREASSGYVDGTGHWCVRQRISPIGQPMEFALHSHVTLDAAIDAALASAKKGASDGR